LQSSLEILRFKPEWFTHQPTGVGLQHGSEKNGVSREKGRRSRIAGSNPFESPFPCRVLLLPHRIHLSAVAQGPSHLEFMIVLSRSLGFSALCSCSTILTTSCQHPQSSTLRSISRWKILAEYWTLCYPCKRCHLQWTSSESMFESPVYFRRRLPRQVLYYEVILRWLLPSLQTCCHGEATSFVH